MIKIDRMDRLKKIREKLEYLENNGPTEEDDCCSLAIEGSLHFTDMLLDDESKIHLLNIINYLLNYTPEGYENREKLYHYISQEITDIDNDKYPSLRSK